MSKKTLANMSLIIIEIDELLLSNKDYKGIKALSHSYLSLLDTLRQSNDELKNKDCINEVLNQKQLLKFLLKKIEGVSVPKLLKEKSYINVNHVTTTALRISEIIKTVDKLLYDLFKSYNPKVLIISESRKSDELVFKTFIEDRNEEIIEHIQMRNYSEILTSKYKYTILRTINEHYRGHRFDYVYIDNELEEKFKDLYSTLAKNKEGIVLF